MAEIRPLNEYILVECSSESSIGQILVPRSDESRCVVATVIDPGLSKSVNKGDKIIATNWSLKKLDQVAAFALGIPLKETENLACVEESKMLAKISESELHPMNDHVFVKASPSEGQIITIETENCSGSLLGVATHSSKDNKKQTFSDLHPGSFVFFPKHSKIGNGDGLCGVKIGDYAISSSARSYSFVPRKDLYMQILS